MSVSGFISYKRVNWTGQTPWNPTNLNIMDKGIKDNNDMIANLRDNLSALNSRIGNGLYTKNFTGRDGQSALDVIKTAVSNKSFPANGIYTGYLSKGTLSGYICLSVANNYQGFIIWGYNETYPIYAIHRNGTWTTSNIATSDKSIITHGNTIITYVPAIGMVNIKPNKLTNSIVINKWTTIVQIPEQYRPSRVIQFPVTVYNPEAFAAYGQLTTDGNLQIYSDTPIKKDQGQTFYNFTYFI